MSTVCHHPIGAISVHDFHDDRVSVHCNSYSGCNTTFRVTVPRSWSVSVLSLRELRKTLPVQLTGKAHLDVEVSAA